MASLLKNVVVVGYPKSGNTWVTRLTAELLNCPVSGFWQEPDHTEIACEGLERPVQIQCFKAHHLLADLAIDVSSSANKVIYVVRDPRDIVLSGASFFRFNGFPETRETLEKLPLGKAVYQKVFYPILHYRQLKIEQMIDTILQGNQDISWCDIPWKKHYKSYLDSPALFVRYEDLLANPVGEATRILEYLNQSRDLSFIESVVERQSFDRKKQEFARKKEKYKAMFMRSGKSGEWRKRLSTAQKKRLTKSLKPDLKFFSYETECLEVR